MRTKQIHIDLKRWINVVETKRERREGRGARVRHTGRQRETEWGREEKRSEIERKREGG